MWPRAEVQSDWWLLERRKEEAERRAERRKLYNAEKAKVDSLLATANSWRKSQKLREYIEARRQQHLAEHGAVEPIGEP